MLALLQQALTDLYFRAQEYAPTILAAMFLVLAGWGLATILGALITRFASIVASRLAAHRKYGASVSGGTFESMPRFAGRIVFWLTLLVFVSAAMEQLQFQVFAGLLGRFTEYLPNVFLAMLVLVAGLAFGRFAREGVASAIDAAGIGAAALIGRLSQISIVLVAGVVAADQIGVDSAFLMLIIGITLGTTLGGMALAFGIGSGPVASNVVASYYVRQMYHPGLRIRVGTVEGRIIEIRSTAVALETPDGRVQIPCRRFLDEASTELGDS